MTPAYIKANERCIKKLIKARNLLQANLRAIDITDVFKTIHYCLCQGVDPVGGGHVGDVHRPSTTLELMPFINRKVSEAKLELRLFETELTNKIGEISRCIEDYRFNH